MTTRSVTTGPMLISDKLHYAKEWAGGDGHYVPDSVGPIVKWNNYQMASARFHSSNPNKIGVIDEHGIYGPPNQYYLLTDHRWFATVGMGYEPRPDGTVNSTWSEGLFNLYWDSESETAIQTKLLNRIKGHSLHLGVALAEVDKLAGTVHDTLRNLVWGLRDLRAGRFWAFFRRFGVSPPSRVKVKQLTTLDISGRFLETRYCWEPTLSDCYQSVRAFEAISQGPRKKIFKKKINVEGSQPYRTNYCVGEESYKVRRTYNFEMYEELEFARQVGLVDPLSVIWERIPFSFVFDWFMPIGNYLNLIGQIPFMKGRWLRTDSIRMSFGGSLTIDPVYGLTQSTPVPISEWEIFLLKRDPLNLDSGLPVPKPEFKVAGAVQGKRLQNAIALAHQIFFGDRNDRRRTYHY
jgi:hypothetical protein